MPINIFVSFEFDRDNDLKNNFLEQARKNTQHRVRNWSLDEAYPDETWGTGRGRLLGNAMSWSS